VTHCSLQRSLQAKQAILTLRPFSLFCSTSGLAASIPSSSFPASLNAESPETRHFAKYTAQLLRLVLLFRREPSTGAR